MINRIKHHAQHISKNQTGTTDSYLRQFISHQLPSIMITTCLCPTATIKPNNTLYTRTILKLLIRFSVHIPLIATTISSQSLRHLNFMYQHRWIRYLPIHFTQVFIFSRIITHIRRGLPIGK